jgi:ferredoxin/flavodoxin---NADP+ reductase
MFDIVRTRVLAPDIKLFEIRAPRIASKQRAGQFVILRLYDRGERIPLTIAGADPAAGTITLIVQGIGKTTRLLNLLEQGDRILDVVGPLGKPSEVERYGTVAVIGGGVGTAIAYPTARAMKEAGNHVVVIVGARTKELVILEAELRAATDETYVLTDDGTYGERGFVTAKLKDLIEARRSIDLVLAIGPVPMMRAVSELTRPNGIRTVVSLNSIMVDGTGMCGGCRVLVGGGSRFACVDGPEFDAHEVDFGVLAKRNAFYRESERLSLEEFERDKAAQLAAVRRSCALEAAHPEVAEIAGALR